MVTILPTRIARSRLVREVATTYAGFLVNAVLGFITLRLMAQHLGVGAFGVATLANIFMTVVAGLGEPGIGTALVRMASKEGAGREKIQELVVAAVRLKLAVVAAVCGLTYVLLPWIATVFMHRPELTSLFRGCLVGAGFLSMASFAGALFQIRRAFRDNTATIAVASVVRTAMVVGLCAGGRLSLQTAIGSMVLMNAVQCGLCVYFLRPMLMALPWRTPGRQQTVELVEYARCLVIWLLAGTIYPRADTMLLPHYVTDDRLVGFYSAAAQLCLLVPWLMVAVNLVLLPRISALRSSGEMKTALRSQVAAAVAIFIVFTPVTLLAGPLVHLIYGPHYGASVPIFRLLLFASAAELALNPLSNFWHALNRPSMLSALTTTRLALLLFTAVLAIPRLGLLGAALAVIVSTVIPLVGQGVILWTTIHHGATAQTARADVVLSEG
jgi:O-antigen/teichoic acid export membrane protein